MTLHLKNSPRSAGTRRLLIGLAAVAGLVCGAGGALAQGQRTRSIPPTPPAPAAAPASPFGATSPTPPPAPSPLAPRVFALSGGGGASYIFKSNENGREIELQLENDEIVAAKIDGEDVPKDRIVHEGNTILFKDEHGEAVFEHTVTRPNTLWLGSQSGLNNRYRIARGMQADSKAWQNVQGHLLIPDDSIAIAMEPPKVMLGLTMMEPDASLRGHLGLEPGTTTLVGAIYGGLPADAAGLEPYDIIIAINGEKPADTETIRKALREKNPGDEVKLTVIHRGKEREATVKLETYDRDRFDETKVRAITQVFDEGDARFDSLLGNAAIASGQGGFVGVGKDPVGAFHPFIAAQSGTDLKQLIADLEARSAEEAARAQQLQERLIDKSAQTKSMEERMLRLEKLLEKLLENREKDDEGGPGADAAPLPEELRPAKGLWAGRNPAA